MSLHGVYDSQNISAKTTRDETPCHKVYEDKDMFAFLDLFPQSYEHILAISKHVEVHSLFEISVQSLAKVTVTVQRLTRAPVEEVQPDGVQVTQFNDTPTGQAVFHIHFHVIPRFSDEGLDIHATKQGDLEVLAQLQERLAQRLQG